MNKKSKSTAKPKKSENKNKKANKKTSINTLEARDMSSVMQKLKKANTSFSKKYPGDSGERQPVHTVYGGAHLFKADLTQKMGKASLKAMQLNAPNASEFAKILGLTLSQQLAKTVYDRVIEKLNREPIEDFRIDFEDGFGSRPDDEEDATAVKAAEETALGMKQNSLPPFIGIRIKTFSEELKARAIRTLDIYVSTLAKLTDGKLPNNFIVTLPKVTIPEQVTALVDLFEVLEKKTKLKKNSLKLEIMIETTQSIINANGESTIPLLVKAARGRCRGAHFGTYDYTASCNITAQHQTMINPVCDFARHVMAVTLAGTGLQISDGATNVMPIGPHRAEKGSTLSPEQEQQNREIVHRAWNLSYLHISHSLRMGYYQGWDLHPAQLPIRYAAMYGFFLEGLEEASNRLNNFIGKAAQATLVGDVFDDAATGQGLLNYFLRALNCGAITMAEIEATGLTIDEIQSRSFAAILNSRRKK